MKNTIDNFRLLNSKQRSFILNDDQLLSDLVRTNMSEKRFRHSLGVAKLAMELAIKHHVNIHQAYLAGLLHDISKEFPEQWQDEYLKYYDKDKLNAPEGVKHSYTAKYYLKEKLGFNDKDVLNAIYNHTICESNAKLAKIIYIADKREEGRHIDDDIVEMAFIDLDKAFHKLEENVADYLKEGNING